MAHRTATILGTAVGACALVGVGAAAVVALTGSGDRPDSPAAATVADLPTVTDFSVRGSEDGCVYDEERGGLVLEDLTVESGSSGVLELTFHVQRDSLDDILPGYVSTVLVLDGETPRRTFDLVIPVSRADHEAGYDQCRWSTGGD